MRHSWLAILVLSGWVGCASSTPMLPPPTGENERAGGPAQAALKQVPAAEPAELLEPGDTLEVIVRRGAGEEKYTASISANGIVTVALMDINVKGLTEAEAEARITEQLMSVIRNPRVQVRLIQKGVTRAKNFYILGEVKGPGKYPLGRRTTILQAIGQGGGYTDVADLEKIIVISRQVDPPQIRVANIQQVLVNGEVSADLQLADDDVVFVPRSGIGDFNHYYTKVAQPILNSILGVVNAVFIGKALEVLFRTPVSPAVAVPCWVARVLYGDHAWQTHLLRWYIGGPLAEHWQGRVFANLYVRYGQEVAQLLRDHPSLQILIRPLFNYLLQQALLEVDRQIVPKTPVQPARQPLLGTG
ncbi:MAG: polysaccharide export protein [Nitrospirae bacterium]|nr:polysaccharide export protein [Nitrospirota bacterium]